MEWVFGSWLVVVAVVAWECIENIAGGLLNYYNNTNNNPNELFHYVWKVNNKKKEQERRTPDVGYVLKSYFMRTHNFSITFHMQRLIIQLIFFFSFLKGLFLYRTAKRGWA